MVNAIQQIIKLIWISNLHQFKNELLCKNFEFWIIHLFLVELITSMMSTEVISNYFYSHLMFPEKYDRS